MSGPDTGASEPAATAAGPARGRAAQVLLVAAAFVIVVAGLRAAEAILIPFLLAAFIAVLSAPPLFWLQRKGLPTGLALVAVILGILCAGLALAAVVGSAVDDFSRDLPAYRETLKGQTAGAVAWLRGHGVELSDRSLGSVFDPGGALQLAGRLLNGLGAVLANGFLILMTVIFILLEASSLPAKLRSMLGDPDASLSRFEHFIGTVKQYMVIKTWVSLVTGVLVAIWLAVLDIPYPVLWGTLSFALNYVPNIGSIIAAVPAVVLAVIDPGPMAALGAAIGFVVVNVLMGNVIEPRFMGRGLGLSTLVVFLSLVFWGWVLGPVGMLLSVPLTVTVKIALDSRDETRWLAVLLGPAAPAPRESPRGDAG